MSALEFTDPPEATSGRRPKYMTKEVRAQLDARPGEWAQVAHKADRAARDGFQRFCYRHPEYEATTRGTEDGVDIWVRRVAG